MTQCACTGQKMAFRVGEQDGDTMGGAGSIFGSLRVVHNL